jgi:hypothetical protein
MSVHPNTFIEPFPKISQSSVKDIWSVTPVSALDEIHKDLYMKLSKQAEEIAELTKLCQTFKAQADEASSLKGGISSEIIALKGDISSEIIALKGDISCEIITVKGDINCEINSLKSEIASLKQATASAAALAVAEQEEMKRLIAEDKDYDADWEEVGRIVNAGLVPLEERLKSLQNEIKLQNSYTSFKRLHEEIASSKRDLASAAAVVKDMEEMKRELAQTKKTIRYESSSDNVKALKEVFGSFCLCLSEHSYEPLRYVGIATYRVLYPNEWRAAQAEALVHGYRSLVGIKSHVKHIGQRISWDGSEQSEGR